MAAENGEKPKSGISITQPLLLTVLPNLPHNNFFRGWELLRIGENILLCNDSFSKSKMAPNYGQRKVSLLYLCKRGVPLVVATKYVCVTLIPFGNVDWTPRNKLQWNVNRNSYIFIQENPFDNVVWKMASIMSRPQCVKTVVFLCTTCFHHKHCFAVLNQIYLNSNCDLCSGALNWSFFSLSSFFVCSMSGMQRIYGILYWYRLFIFAIYLVIHEMCCR